MMLSPLEAQPVEILDQVFEHIPNQSDLLSLAFASPDVVANAIIPRHLPRCCLDVQNISLIRRLSVSSLRLRIFSLELVSQGDDHTRTHIYGDPAQSLPDTEIVKPEVVEASDMLVSDSAVVSLLRGMMNLRNFHWNVAGIQPSKNIFIALRSITTLDSVKVHSLRAYGNNNVPDNWFLRGSPLWTFSNLTSFSFAVSSLTSFYHTKEYIRELVAMLQRCIKLQDLELMLAHDIPSDLQPLFQGRWPLLKKFLLGGSGRRSSSVRIPLSSKVDVQSFFDAHPTIEVLYLNVHLENWPKWPVDVNGLTAASYGIDSLPNLEFLHVAQNVFSLISPATIMPKLKHIRLVEIEPVQLPFFRELGPGLVNLTSIWMVLHSSITISDIKPFFACIPQVKSLFMRGNPPEPWVPIVRMPPDFYREAVPMSIPIVVWALPQQTDPLDELLDTVSVLPHLTHLGNFVVFHARDNFDDLVDPVVRRLADTLPELQYLELLISTGHDDTAVPSKRGLVADYCWIEIKRDWNGDFLEWKLAEAEDLGFDSWGSLKWPVC